MLLVTFNLKTQIFLAGHFNRKGPFRNNPGKRCDFTLYHRAFT